MNTVQRFLAKTFFKDLVLNYPGTAIPVVIAGPDGNTIAVSDQTAQTIDTVYACARIVAEQISTMPVRVAKIDPKTRIKEYKPEHPLQFVIDNPVTYTNRNAYWQKALYHLQLWGNHYAEITRSDGGDVVGYNLLHPRFTQYKPETGMYMYDDGERKRAIQPFDICHVVLPGEDPVNGTSLIGQVARNDLRHVLAVKRYGTGFFEKGGKPNNIITTKDNITPEQAKEWQQYYEKHYAKGGTAILGGADDIKNLTFPPEDSQFLETRYADVETVCRWMNVDPPLVAHLKDGTLSNFETIWRNFAKKSLLPLSEQIESEYTRKSFRDSQYRKGYRFEFDYTQLTKGSPMEEAELLRTYIQNGVLKPNEARQRIGQNPEPGGDDLLIQLNMVPLKMIEEINEPDNRENTEGFPSPPDGE